MTLAFQGHTERRGLIHHFIADPTAPIEHDEPPAVDWGDYQTPASIAQAIDEHDWTDDELKRAHAAYVAGDHRNPWTIAGHREWARRYRAEKRRQQRMSAEDIAWCTRAANDWFWAAWERGNRAENNPLQAEAERRITQRLRQRGAA